VIAALPARAHGDLKENAGDHAAGSRVLSKVAASAAWLSPVIDVTNLNTGGKIVFGATVTVVDEESGEETTYQIVGDLEADIKHSRIAVSSPIARALIGRSAGDAVVVRAPGGDREFEIIDVSYS
jgi:transcription elongation factor GreA